jgi:hypothetical protein
MNGKFSGYEKTFCQLFNGNFHLSARNSFALNSFVSSPALLPLLAKSFSFHIKVFSVFRLNLMLFFLSDIRRGRRERSEAHSRAMI